MRGPRRRFPRGCARALLASGLALCPAALAAQGSVAPQPGTLTRLPWIASAPEAGVRPLPLAFLTSFRSAWADDRDNGALWAGKGVSALIRGGVAWRRGPLTILLAPEVTMATNGDYRRADGVRPGHSEFSAPWMVIDLPRRWGDGVAVAVHPGQSLVELRWAGFAVGATSANVVRGPEVRYPVLLGSSGPGVPSVFLEGGSVLGPLGHLSGRVQWGVTHESPYFDSDSGNDRNLLSVFALDWSPGFARGLVVGASLTYRDPLAGGFSPSMLWKAFSTTSAQDLEQLREDALAALHARWETGPLAVWGSWGRNDYWLNTEDLLTEPDHSQLYALGAAVTWPAGAAATWTLAAESASTLEYIGRSGNTYRHGQSQGYTHEGQMLAASIGPGARAAWAGLQRSDSTRTWGLDTERILRELDVYNRVFDRRDGSDGEDGEWRFSALYEGRAPGFGAADVGLRANGGVSLRWNRDYIRYSEDAVPPGGPETNWFLDVALTWRPAGRAR